MKSLSRFFKWEGFLFLTKNTEGFANFKEALNLGFIQKYNTEAEEFYKHYCYTTKF